ncbi:TMhelix containing protein [Vibrio phage 1.187.O._10N.286.49.F1]|nr:TMhelix containing protein [Vibrio phage 1.187.O._10N.286.49.F1]
MSNKFILAVFIFLMSGLIALGLQSNPAQTKCEKLNQNKPELLKLCPTLGN